jgi:hypothetical protein
MLKYSENNRNIIESDEGFSIETQGTNVIIYKDSGKSLKLYREFMAGTTDILIAGEMDKWITGEAIDKSARDRVLDNVKRAFAFKGAKVTFRIGGGFYVDGKSIVPDGWSGRC